MNTIHKFPFKLDDSFSLLLTSKAKILSIQIQDSGFVAWALLNTDDTMVKRNFQIYGTGHAMPNDLSKHSYITTLQGENGFVWHIFEILN